MGILESDTLGGEAIDIGCCDVGVTVAAQVLAVVFGDDQEDIQGGTYHERRKRTGNESILTAYITDVNSRLPSNCDRGTG